MVQILPLSPTIEKGQYLVLARFDKIFMVMVCKLFTDHLGLFLGKGKRMPFCRFVACGGSSPPPGDDHLPPPHPPSFSHFLLFFYFLAPSISEPEKGSSNGPFIFSPLRGPPDPWEQRRSDGGEGPGCDHRQGWDEAVVEGHAMSGEDHRAGAHHGLPPPRPHLSRRTSPEALRRRCCLHLRQPRSALPSNSPFFLRAFQELLHCGISICCSEIGDPLLNRLILTLVLSLCWEDEALFGIG